MPESELGQPNLPPVNEAESGEKLLRFLERRLALPRNLLHRWLRTGQIRLNGKRAKPFEQVFTGDRVRVPPFAHRLAPLAGQDCACEGELPPLLGKSGAIWAFNKSAGLAVQPGSGQQRSLAGLLKARYKDAPFVPAPAHRLDLETSGVLLVGASHAALAELTRLFAEGRIHKEYLAWVKGAVPWRGSRLLRHYLDQDDQMQFYAEPVPGAMEAVCNVRPLLVAPDQSLLQINLLTGRKHQIRRQLAACGFPVIGDRRYGEAEDALLLHALRATLPDGVEFACLPPWKGRHAVSELPPVMPRQEFNRKESENL